MKILLSCSLIVVQLLLHGTVYGASAKCVVIKKEGNVLVMDCGRRAEGFGEKARVKIKTDRGER